MAPANNPSPITTIWVVLFVVATSSAALSGQTVGRFLPSRDYEVRLLAAPREPVTAAKLVFNMSGPSQFGNTGEGEVALGAALPLYLISGSTTEDGLVVGLQGAVFGRFTLTTITRDLIATDWMFAAPLTWHLGEDWLRLRYLHKSSHLGDEYIARFGANVGDYSRDAADLTAFFKASPTIGLYGGGNWAFNVHPNGARRFLLRAGLEVETDYDDRTLLPYGAVDVEWEQDNEWEPRLNLQLGVRLPKLTDRRAVRLALEFLAGPSPQGQFRTEHVRQVTIGLFIDP